MIKDLLGEILSAKKGKAMTVTINIENEQPETEEEGLKKAGMAPELKAEGEEQPEEMDKMSLLNGEEDEMAGKMKKGLAPKNLAERAKMKLLEK